MRFGVLLLAVALVAGCGASNETTSVGEAVDDRPTTTSEVPTSERTTTTAERTTTSPPTTVAATTTTSAAPRVPTVLWRPYETAEENLEDADLTPLAAGLDAWEIEDPGDDWLVVGASKADAYGNVGLVVATRDQLSDGVRVDLRSDTNLLYASIRKARQDVWAFARTTGDDPLRAANRCAERIFDAIGQDDLVVLCYVYDNRDQFDAEGRNEDAESSTGLVCARAYGTFDGDREYGQDLAPADAGCPRGESDVGGTGIERVPVPDGAVSTGSQDGSGGIADADARSFVVPDMRFDELVAFYDFAMPIGASYRGWPWCERHNEVATIDERVWLDPGRSGTGLLRVTLLDDDGGPAVIVARHGACVAMNGS